MKKLLFLFLLLPISLSAQPNLVSLQESWTDSIKARASASSFYWEGRNFTFTKINTSDSESLIKLSRSEKITGLGPYEHLETFKHDEYRYIIVGTLPTNTETMLLLTGWRNVEGSWKKEIDVILTHEVNQFKLSDELTIALNKRRASWITRANQHNPKKHIEALYSKEATYFANGRKSEGREEIIERYVYMENPNYQVDLEKEQLWNISEDQVLEVGRYFTGSERVGPGGLYVILWELVDEEWMIRLDFNF